MFRSGSRTGHWMACLLPLVLSNDQLNLIALSTSIYSIFYTLESSEENLTKAKSDTTKIRFKQGEAKPKWILTLVVALLASSSVMSVLLYPLAFLAFVHILPQLFLTFQSSFSFGEGVLVLQCIVIFIVKLIMNTVQEIHDPSTIEGGFYIIANAGLGSVCVLCLLFYSPVKLFQYQATFYLLGKSLYSHLIVGQFVF